MCVIVEMMYFVIALLFLHIIQCNSNDNNDIEKPTSVGNDKIKYFHKVVRVAHPTTSHPHVTLLFRMKIGDDVFKEIDKFCVFNQVIDCEPLREQFSYNYYEFLSLHNINLDDYKNDNNTCEVNKNRDINVVSCSKRLQSKKNSKYNVINNITTNSNIKDFQSGGKILSVVSGWWNVTKSKSKIDTYYNWFKTSLRINMPYVFFTDTENFESFTRYRRDICTVLVPKKMSEFLTYDSYKEEWTDPLHVPSRELGMIWLEKINLLMEAAKIVDSEYLAWVDAGLPLFRSNHPPPEEWFEDVIKSLPYDRVGYAYVKDSYNTHSFGGGFLIMHRSIIPLVHYLFYNQYDIARKEYGDWRVGSDQIIFTDVREKYPELFHAPTYDYGDIQFLWKNIYHATGPNNQEIDWDF